MKNRNLKRHVYVHISTHNVATTDEMDAVNVNNNEYESVGEISECNRKK